MPTSVLELHTIQCDLLSKHVEYFKGSGDDARAGQYAAELRHTTDRVGHLQTAATLVDRLGLSHEIRPDTITYNDALRYVAKVLHEVRQGQKRSHYQRGHRHLEVAGLVDASKMQAPWDPAQDVIDHLGLTDPQIVAAARDLFSGKAV